MANRLDDGNYSTGFQVGPPRVTRPFLGYPTPDKYARIIERDWAIIPANYNPATANRTAYSNLLTYSEDFTNAAWTLTALSTPVSFIANPGNGLLTANLLSETAANSEHRAAHAFTFTAVPHTFSIFVKGLVRTFAYLRANDGTTDFTAYFNLATGAVGTLGANTTGAIVACGDGWYRCSITFTPAAAAGNVYANVASDASTISYAGTTADGMYFFGAQVEAAASAGPYISTTTALRSILAPDLDPGDTVSPADPFAYLVAETTPLVADFTGRAKFVRRWARIPKQQIVPCSIALNKPTLDRYGATLGHFHDWTSGSDVDKGVSYSYAGRCFANNSVYGYAAPAGFFAAAAATGGTFTVTYKTSTTAALNSTETNANIKTALDALADCISDGVTWTVNNSLPSSTYKFITFTPATGTPQAYLTVNVASLTGLVIADVMYTHTNLASLQKATLASYFSSTAHGITTADSLMVETVTTLVCNLYPYVVGHAGQWAIYDADRILFLADTQRTHFGKYLLSYTPGTDTAIGQQVSDFYLPGVTAGITTKDDIAIPDTAINEQALLNLITSGATGYQTYSISGLAPWLGPILELKQVQLNVGNL